MLKNFLKKAKNFSELVMFEHTIFSASFSFIAICVALMYKYFSQTFSWGESIKLFILCILALISARNFAMGFNRLCDRDIDSKNERTKNRPSVDGRIGLLGIIVFCLINAGIFIFTSYFINDLAFYLSFLFLFILGFYSLMKRFSILAHFVLGLSLGLAPIAGAIAILGFIPLWSIFLSLGVLFWVAGFDLLYSLQDMEFDRQQKLFSFPSKFGVKKTLIYSRISHFSAVVFWILFLCEIDSGMFGIIGVVSAGMMLCYEQYIVAKDLKNIPRAFFVTNGYLGFVFLSFIVLEVLARIFYA
ncbi:MULTISPECIES: menaquinone biosynthesis prenyltransferase MqnP [unclassified Helicobacter]|uniref:menaquinone biosynthesis prenyltransferase MqnP n=1 Tax=unclassified Helicobacter TaxID=2593540 RepID=UPI00227990BC|nr:MULTISPECIES: menaquinone biosynthesis prenyltransferase MqnP [unclassified Helicobacter]